MIEKHKAELILLSYIKMHQSDLLTALQTGKKVTIYFNANQKLIVELKDN